MTDDKQPDAFTAMKDSQKLLDALEAQTEGMPKGPGEKTKTEKYRRRYFGLNDGFAWNPLRQYPRNKSCFCGSGFKAKRCCLPILMEAIPDETAKYVLDNWELLLQGRVTVKRPGL